MGSKFNCTGMLNSKIMPGKVALKIPEMQKPFRVGAIYFSRIKIGLDNDYTE